MCRKTDKWNKYPDCHEIPGKVLTITGKWISMIIIEDVIAMMQKKIFHFIYRELGR